MNHLDCHVFFDSTLHPVPPVACGDRVDLSADPAQWVTTDAVAEVIHYLTTPAASAVSGAAVRVPGRTL